MICLICKRSYQLDDERKKRCLLIIDKVQVKSKSQYNGGIIFGKAVNQPNKLANTVLSFMLIGLSGGPKFLCRMIPVKERNAISLFEQADIIIKGVKQVGGELAAIIYDGNRVNQSFFRMFDTHIENS